MISKLLLSSLVLVLLTFISAIDAELRKSSNKDAEESFQAGLRALENEVRYEEANEFFVQAKHMFKARGHVSTEKICLYHEGISLFKLQKFQAAIRKYDEVLKIDSNFEKAKFEKAKALIQSQYLSDLRKAFMILEELDEERLAKDQADNLPRLIEHVYQRLTQKAKNIFKAGQAALDTEDRHDMALKLFQKANDIFEDTGDFSMRKKCLYHEGLSLFKLEYFPGAVEKYDLALRIDPNFEMAKCEKARALMHFEDVSHLKEALIILQQLKANKLTEEQKQYQSVLIEQVYKRLHQEARRLFQAGVVALNTGKQSPEALALFQQAKIEAAREKST